MSDKYTAETAPYKATPPKQTFGSAPTTYPGQPKVTIDPFSYGKDGGTANAMGTVPSVQVGGSFEVGTLPDAFNGDFGIGDDKNVSTPVTGL